MGVSMDEETDAILGDIGGMLEGAGPVSYTHLDVYKRKVLSRQ